MDSFVGRVDELRNLNGIYEKSPVACAICGRRHLGKSALVREFCKDKAHIYLTGMYGLRSENLREMAESIGRFTGKDVKLDDIIDLFPTLRSVCGRKKVVVVIDRFSDLVENFPEVNSYLRSFMSREINSTKIMLLVCDTDSSIFGRFYYTMDIRPMTYIECKGFHPGYTSMQHFMVFSLVGGCPAYQRLFGENPDEAIRDQFFDHMSVFSLESEGMVNAEAMIRPACIKILSAMADGAENTKDIAARAEISNALCNKLVDDLEHKGLLRKEVATGPSKRAVYSIDSYMLRFFYEVVNRYTHQVEFESPADAYQRAKHDIDAYLDRRFSELCMDYITLNYDYSFVGKLRSKDDAKDKIVDFVASYTENGIRRTVIAACRLHGYTVTVEDYERLAARGKGVDGANKMYMMFSGVGFSPELRTMASKDKNIRLLTLDDIYKS